MSLAKIGTGVLPPEVGPDGERLIVIVDGKYYESVLIENPMTIDCAIEKLELLAELLKRVKRAHKL